MDQTLAHVVIAIFEEEDKADTRIRHHQDQEEGQPQQAEEGLEDREAPDPG